MGSGRKRNDSYPRRGESLRRYQYWFFPGAPSTELRRKIAVIVFMRRRKRKLLPIEVNAGDKGCGRAGFPSSPTNSGS